MAAPTQRSHHVKGEVCTNRPRYREGRNPKAVKVYTVNQESRYLLVQGVPTVGAQHELIKLFALYGAVEEYYLLDEYPAEEFTEVYWIKYSKIQAARYAKRKLDDYSFFGGNLHLCYAPEFESVLETRQKLQERRKEISKRTRNLGNNTTAAASNSSANHDQLSYPTDGKTPNAVLPPDGLQQNHHTSGFTDRNVESQMDKTETKQTSQEITKQPVTFSAPGLPYPSIAPHDYVPAATYPNPQSGHEFDVYPPPRLPLPPHHMPPGMTQPPPRGSQQTEWGHARVPSAHATLPRELQTVRGSLQQYNSGHPPYFPPSSRLGWQSDSHVPSQQHQHINSGHGSFHSQPEVKNANLGSTSQSRSLVSEHTGSHESQKHSVVSEKNVIKSKNRPPSQPPPGRLPTEKIIIKDFKFKGTKPRFVPRQLTMPAVDVGKVKSDKKTEDVNQQIRQNAFILTKPSGPVLPPSEQIQHEENNKRKAELDPTIETTRAKIRQKLKAFSTLDPLPAVKKKT